MLFYFIRHGDPIYNPDSLTEKGKEQAEALAVRLERAGIDKIYASSSVRAIQTAEPLAKRLGKDIEILDWCNENYTFREFSIEENGERRWIFQSPQLLKLFLSDEVLSLGHKWFKHSAFKGTQCEQGIIRIARNSDDFFRSLGYIHNAKERFYEASEPNEMRIALFAHEGFSHVFLPYVLDLPYPVFARFEYGHTGMSVIDFRTYSGGMTFAKLMQYSNDSHLYKEGLPTEYNNRIMV